MTRFEKGVLILFGIGILSLFRVGILEVVEEPWVAYHCREAGYNGASNTSVMGVSWQCEVKGPDGEWMSVPYARRGDYELEVLNWRRYGRNDEGCH